MIYKFSEELMEKRMKVMKWVVLSISAFIGFLLIGFKLGGSFRDIPLSLFLGIVIVMVVSVSVCTWLASKKASNQLRSITLEVEQNSLKVNSLDSSYSVFLDSVSAVTVELYKDEPVRILLAADGKKYSVAGFDGMDKILSGLESRLINLEFERKIRKFNPIGFAIFAAIGLLLLSFFAVKVASFFGFFSIAVSLLLIGYGVYLQFYSPITIQTRKNLGWFIILIGVWEAFDFFFFK